MKRSIRVGLVVLLAMAVIMPAFFGVGMNSATASQDVRVVLNGREVEFPDQKAMIIQGRTLVPVRFITEALGATVDWMDATFTVIIRFETKEILLRIGSRQVHVAGEIVDIDVPAQIIGGRTMVPLRFVSEIMGSLVEWDDQTRSVLIRSALPPAQPKAEDPPPPAVLWPSEIFAKVSPAVVLVEIFDAKNDMLGMGSGFIVRPDGRIVTNYHVIEGAHYIRVTTEDGVEFTVTSIVAEDRGRDLAVLQVNGAKLPHVELADSTEVSTGARIYTIGNPLGLKNTLSEGLVSSAWRLVEGQYYIQISAPVSPGNSGGVLVDQYGRVIGVTTASFMAGQNLNLAIPLSDVWSILDVADLESNAISLYAVSGVSLSHSTLSLTVGSSEQLVASVFPPHASNKSVMWVSSSPFVASVDTAGIVHARSVGEAVITVTTLDGSKRESCVVTVRARSTGDGAPLVGSIRGNSVGNIANHGFVTYDNGWLYLASRNLVRVRPDGSDRTILADGNTYFVNVVGDWVYFSSPYDERRISKVRTDGTGRTKLNDDASWDVQVVDSWIYYRNQSDQWALYRMRTDGSERTRLSDRTGTNMAVIDDWIYYFSGGSLQVMRIDGTQKRTISQNPGMYVQVIDGWIYHADASDGGIVKMRTDGSGRQFVISQDQVGFVNVVGDWVYYQNKSHDEYLYRVRTDGTERTQLTSEPANFINVVEGWVYYYNSRAITGMKKVRIDGTGQQSVQ